MKAEKKNKTYAKVDEAVVVLRRSLSEAEDKSITIVTVGFLTNIRSLIFCSNRIDSSVFFVQLGMPSYVDIM